MSAGPRSPLDCGAHGGRPRCASAPAEKGTPIDSSRPESTSQALPDAEALLSRFVEESDDLMTIVDLEARFLYVNPAAGKFFAGPTADREGLLGRCAFEFIHPEDRERTRAVFEKWVKDHRRNPFTHENRQVGFDGEVRTVTWNVHKHVSRDGELLTLVSSARDITATRRHLDELREHEVRLATLLRGMLDAVITIDPRGIIQETSDSVLTTFGYSPSELVGKNIKLLMPEPHFSQHDEYLANYRRTGKTWILNTTREFEVLKKNGARITCELSVSRIDVPGKPEPLFCGSFRNVTSRKEAEAALEVSERRFRAIFEQEFQYVGLLTPEGDILEINRAALDAAGVRREDILGHPFWETSWWAHSDEARRQVREAVERARHGEFVRFETEFEGGAGDTRTVDFSIKPLRGEDGIVQLLIPEGRDITELKRAQQRETAMLKALATVGESAAVLAHEIKNPITSVNLALRAVADKIGEDHRVVLEELSSRMQGLERLMRRTLSFTRPLDMDRVPCEVGELFEHASHQLLPEMERAGIRVETRVEDGCPRVLADRDLLEEVLTNLIRNSVDVLEEKGLIRLSAACGGDRVRIRVQDDGPGIPPAMRETLFRPFVTTKSTGSGLGLAVCRKILEEHGGSIELAEGELGGAAFDLCVPVAPAAAG